MQVAITTRCVHQASVGSDALGQLDLPLALVAALGAPRTCRVTTLASITDRDAV